MLYCSITYCMSIWQTFHLKCIDFFMLLVSSPTGVGGFYSTQRGFLSSLTSLSIFHFRISVGWWHKNWWEWTHRIAVVGTFHSHLYKYIQRTDSWFKSHALLHDNIWSSYKHIINNCKHELKIQIVLENKKYSTYYSLYMFIYIILKLDILHNKYFLYFRYILMLIILLLK